MAILTKRFTLSKKIMGNSFLVIFLIAIFLSYVQEDDGPFFRSYPIHDKE